MKPVLQSKLIRPASISFAKPASTVDSAVELHFNSILSRIIRHLKLAVMCLLVHLTFPRVANPAIDSLANGFVTLECVPSDGPASQADVGAGSKVQLRKGIFLKETFVSP